MYHKFEMKTTNTATHLRDYESRISSVSTNQFIKF